MCEKKKDTRKMLQAESIECAQFLRGLPNNREMTLPVLTGLLNKSVIEPMFPERPPLTQNNVISLCKDCKFKYKGQGSLTMTKLNSHNTKVHEAFRQWLSTITYHLHEIHEGDPSSTLLDIAECEEAMDQLLTNYLKS